MTDAPDIIHQVARKRAEDCTSSIRSRASGPKMAGARFCHRTGERLSKEVNRWQVKEEHRVKEDCQDVAKIELGVTLEQEWQRRNDKRLKELERLKSTVAYQTMTRCIEAGTFQNPCRTPEPNDRTISKRQWERDVMQWRHVLKKFARDAEELEEIRHSVPHEQGNARDH